MQQGFIVRRLQSQIDTNEIMTIIQNFCGLPKSPDTLFTDQQAGPSQGKDTGQLEAMIADLRQTVLLGCLERRSLQSELSEATAKLESTK